MILRNLRGLSHLGVTKADIDAFKGEGVKM